MVSWAWLLLPKASFTLIHSNLDAIALSGQSHLDFLTIKMSDHVVAKAIARSNLPINEKPHSIGDYLRTGI